MSDSEKRSKTCSIEGCENKKNRKGWCSTHYRWWKQRGDPLAPNPKHLMGGTDDERFWARVEKTESCWNWTGGMSGREGARYGSFNIRTSNGFTNKAAHVFAYESTVGPLPKRAPLERCVNERCVNPDHVALKVTEVCAVDGCDRLSEKRGWCGKHHARWVRNGDPESIVRATGVEYILGSANEERFWSRVEKTESCWNWISTTRIGRAGQKCGVLSIKDGKNFKPVTACKFAYEMLVGPLPEGFSIDWLCENSLCVNPEHLDALPLRELRSRTSAERAALLAARLR